MPLVSTGELVSAAAADERGGRGGIAAFNVITLEHAEAIAAGAERAGRPAILQISENAVKFHGGRLTAIAAPPPPSPAPRTPRSRSISTTSNRPNYCAPPTARASAR